LRGGNVVVVVVVGRAVVGRAVVGGAVVGGAVVDDDDDLDPQMDCDWRRTSMPQRAYEAPHFYRRRHCQF